MVLIGNSNQIKEEMMLKEKIIIYNLGKEELDDFKKLFRDCKVIFKNKGDETEIIIEK